VSAQGTASEQGVTAVVETVERGWESLDANMIANNFSEAADWTNALGFHVSGRVQLREFLQRLFANPDFRAGKNTSFAIDGVRFLGADVAVVRTSARRIGQISPGSKQPVDRVVHKLQVLARRDSRWVVESELVSDERHDL
jgi:uncharacterized protein (TIGR02246 family)